VLQCELNKCEVESLYMFTINNDNASQLCTKYLFFQHNDKKIFHCTFATHNNLTENWKTRIHTKKGTLQMQYKDDKDHRHLGNNNAMSNVSYNNNNRFFSQMKKKIT
jgi:hypothetical protein